MKTKWKPIPGYEGLYEASTDGQIRSMSKIIKGKFGQPVQRHERILKPEVTKQGYHRVVLGSNRVFKRWAVHRLILLTFMNTQPDGYVVNHKDGNKSNNCLSNLEYVTQSENVLHSMNELGHFRHGSFNSASKLNDEHVLSILSLYATGKFSKAALGRMFDVTDVLIGVIVRRERWKHVVFLPR